MSLNLIEKTLFEQSLYHPWLFKHVIRPQLYRRNGKDPENVHESVLEMVNRPQVIEILSRNYKLFQEPEELKITINGRKITPFGTAAGMDKNGDALVAFSNVYGFQEPGTVVANPRPGNNKPRVAVDDKLEDTWNAQGFPSKGLPYFLDKIRDLRHLVGQSPTIYVSICGLPLSEQNVIEVAMQEMEKLLKELNPYVDGFVWNPFSPNTATLTHLRTPEIFRETAELMKKEAQDKLLLVKIGPYTEEGKQQAFSLIDGFMEGEGDGIVGVNTVMFPKEQIPVTNWGYPSGGRSGRFLHDYRMRVVKDMRDRYKNAVIVATGGICDGDDAYETFKAGATMLEGYTPYIFRGLGLLPTIERRVTQRLRQGGYQNLEQLQSEARKGVKLAG